MFVLIANLISSIYYKIGLFEVQKQIFKENTVITLFFKVYLGIIFFFKS